MEEYLLAIAKEAIREVIREGAKKPRPCHWVNEDQNMHIQKSARHLLTYQLMRDGHQTPNGENHLKLALTRAAMALAIDRLQDS